MKRIKKILIANRGEIALRIIRTCKEMGIQTVAVYSEVDDTAPHVLSADESVFIGEAASPASYLNIDTIIKVADRMDVDAIHPGYGFLSENAIFANACEKAGLIFIGPDASAIEVMGDKTRARELMAEAGVPCPPGTETALKDIDEARNIADEIGYPVLVKAAAGGGGKGMRIIYEKDQFESGIKAARSEAKNAFGDDRVYIEKYLQSPRHVEFQILADQHGNIVHLFERECSVQRRHQKVIEEAPCSIMTRKLRNEMADAAVAATRSCNYTGAGTIEFLLDADLNFYFLEMNTRLQVEHPVTEMITGIDLVEMQIRVARGETLPVSQDQIEINGHAIECRIYAEDPHDNFLPSTGKLEKHRPPYGPGVRVDAGVEEGGSITIHYDPMISKLCVHAKDRTFAIGRMKRALDEYEVAGCRTTIPFCLYVMGHPGFKAGKYDTHFVEDHFLSDKEHRNEEISEEIVSIVSALLYTNGKENPDGYSRTSGINHPDEVSNWWKKRR